MPIRIPQLKTRPAVICDWLELTVLSSNRFSYPVNRLKRLWDVNRESEATDPEGIVVRELDTDEEGVSGEDADVYLDSVTSEAGERAEVLGDSYPFEFDRRGTRLQVRTELSEAAYIYLFCLLLSNSKAGDVFDGTWLPNVTHRTRDLFQVCSTLAAAGEVRGCAISFGWPRPNNNPPFLTRLRDVYQLFGEGRVRRQALAGASPSPKDEEVDVIAWRPTRDRAPGTEYLLGQVASGDNWEAKSLKGPPIERFHRNWFDPPPPSEARSAIFIPHLIMANQTGARRDVMDQHTVIYGTVFDRLRIPTSAKEGIALADTDASPLVIERRDEVADVVAWVRDQIAQLQAAAQV